MSKQPAFQYIVGNDSVTASAVIHEDSGRLWEAVSKLVDAELTRRASIDASDYEHDRVQKAVADLIEIGLGYDRIRAVLHQRELDRQENEARSS